MWYKKIKLPCFKNDSTYIKDPCANNPCVHGTCILDRNSGQYSCRCNNGYEGQNCDIGKCFISSTINNTKNEIYYFIVCANTVCVRIVIS